MIPDNIEISAGEICEYIEIHFKKDNLRNTAIDALPVRFTPSEPKGDVMSLISDDKKMIHRLIVTIIGDKIRITDLVFIPKSKARPE